ncbi:MAG: pyrimidine-nucleoside phosphorylase [Acholeplasmatales bacterium]|nr:MAG: pyrimidine-nucleoside phosphorylase [Acholeplasmatales bacterium]
MRMVDLIEKKRDQKALSAEEITYIIEGYVAGDIPDYQMSSFLMAVYFNGMTHDETIALTRAILESGETIDLSAIDGIKVDKHSTGGVGDKTTLVLGPLVASCGAKFAKLSGRGLGHTGGTLDKLESIEGFNIDLDSETFVSQVNSINIAVAGQTAKLAPADKLLYALRDVTGTVPSIPLIASSVMSKKLASGADVIVLDVKIGEGAFMKTLESARELSRVMVDIGKAFDKKVIAFITEMSQPLGYAVGNKLEVIEAIRTLQGNGPEDLQMLCVELGSYLIHHAGLSDTLKDARKKIEASIQSLEASDCFRALLEHQGGQMPDLNDYIHAQHIVAVKSETSGYVKTLHALDIGLAAMRLGAGRAKKDDTIDPDVGIVLNKKLGDRVETGDVLAYVYNNLDDITDILRTVMDAFVLDETAPPVKPLIYEIIE